MVLHMVVLLLTTCANRARGPRGLITYRESRLLVDPKEGDVAQVRATHARGRLA